MEKIYNTVQYIVLSNLGLFYTAKYVVRVKIIFIATKVSSEIKQVRYQFIEKEPHLFLVFNIVVDVFNTSIVVILCGLLKTGEE